MGWQNLTKHIKTNYIYIVYYIYNVINTDTLINCGLGKKSFHRL